MTVTSSASATATRANDEIAAVRRTLLADARADAERIVATARQEADDMIHTAVDEADAEVEQERRRSELTAQAYSNRVLARARNDARADVLRRQEALRLELVDRVRAAVLELRNDPRYPALLDRLEALAEGQFEEPPTIERDRDPNGGVVASVGTRHVDYTLPAIADRTLDALSDEAVRLWT